MAKASPLPSPDGSSNGGSTLSTIGNLGNASMPSICAAILWILWTAVYTTLPQMHGEIKTELRSDREKFDKLLVDEREHDQRRNTEMIELTRKNQETILANQRLITDLLTEIRRLKGGAAVDPPEGQTPKGN